MIDIKALKDKTVRVYDKPDGWVEYIKIDGVVYGSAHSYNGKYSILNNVKKFGEIVTELRYNYLLKFYKKHFTVTYIINNLYIIEKE